MDHKVMIKEAGPSSQLSGIINRIHFLHDRAGAVRNLCRDVADRSFGSLPAAPASNAVPVSVPSGAIAEIHAALDGLEQTIAAGVDEASRLNGL